MHRRSHVTALASVALLGLGCVGLDARALPWLQFRLDAGHGATVPGSLRVAWTARTAGPISSSPAASGALAYVGDNAGTFRAVDLRTGGVRWLRQLANPVMTSPLLAGGLVVVGEGNEASYVRRGEVHVGDGTSALVAFDATSGRTVWTRPLLGTAMPSPAIVGETLVEPDGNGDVVGLDPRTGAERYVEHVGTTASMTSALPIGGDRVAFAGQTATEVVAISSRDGSVVWRRPFPSASGLGDCPLAYADGRIVGGYLAPLPGEPYVRAGRRDEQRAFALRASDGAVLWDVPLERGVVPVRNQSAIPLVAGGVVFLGSALAPAMHALDARSGRELWRTRVDGAVKSAPVVARGVLLFGDLGGSFWALDRGSGRVVATRRIGIRTNVGSPIVVGRTLLASGASGKLVALPVDLLAMPPGVAARRLVGPSAGATLALRALDRNRDGALELSEVPARDRALFHVADRNRDGMITASEAPLFVRYAALAPSPITRSSAAGRRHPAA